MKQIISRMNGLLVLVVCLFLAACGGKHEERSSDEWAEMDAFHMIMAEAYHPLKDSSNLAPAKASAEMMTAEADKWADAELPEKVDTKEMKAMLSQLKDRAHEFADRVKAGATDEELATALTAFHDAFHHITEAWYGGHEDHH